MPTTMQPITEPTTLSRAASASIAGPPALTRQGRRLLAEEARRIRHERLPALRPLLVEPDRDERAVQEFERAVAELDWLERLLVEADDVEGPARRQVRSRAVVRLGSRVVVETPDLERETVRIVHPVEASLDDERISATSPLAQALLGARVGDTVWVLAPVGAWPARVVDIVGARRRR